MEAINALNRLDRAGDESSKTTQKLREAATAIAEKIMAAVPGIEIELPRGYQKTVWFCRPCIINSERELINENGSIKALMAFAQDVHEGLLDEISAFMEERTAKLKEAVSLLEEKK